MSTFSNERRIAVIDLHTGQERTAVPQAPVLSSASSPWEGVILEQHAGYGIECEDVACAQHMLFLQLSASAPCELKVGNEPACTLQIEAGQIGILPAMTPISTRTQHSGDFVAVILEPSFLFCAAHEIVNPTGFELKPGLGRDEPLLRACITALQCEAQSGSPHGRLYAESVAATMAAHLVRHHSTQKASLVSVRGGLPRYQLERAIDFIQVHLGEDISLRSIAAEAGLSPYHFARLFKESTGLTPHQYLIRSRVERGKGLLQVADRSIGDVALQVGFCDQSHFSVHFKRVYGVTPREFVRRSVRKRPMAVAGF